LVVWQVKLARHYNDGRTIVEQSLPATKVSGYQYSKPGEFMVKTIFFSSDGDLMLNPIDGTPVFYTKVKESSEIGTNFQGFKESALRYGSTIVGV
jgi:hypothetical protein